MKYLIIGASSGLGRELANKFAKEKNDLIIVSRDIRDLSAIKSDLEIKYGIKVDCISVDFTSIEEIENELFSKETLIRQIKGVLFPVGLMYDQDNVNLNIENMKKLIYSNYLSIAFCIQKLNKYLAQNKDSTIIGFGSVSGLLGRKINSIYAGSKRGLESYFESLAFDEKFKNINIQFYILGYLDTNLSFGKNLKLPKGSIKKLSAIVYKNKCINFKKIIFPNYWRIISFILKLTPFSLIKKLGAILNK